MMYIIHEENHDCLCVAHTVGSGLMWLIMNKWLDGNTLGILENDEENSDNDEKSNKDSNTDSEENESNADSRQHESDINKETALEDFTSTKDFNLNKFKGSFVQFNYKGEKDGIEEGMAVVVSEGLVGYVSDLYDTSCRVKLITNSSYNNTSIKINNVYLILEYDEDNGYYYIWWNT